MVADTSSDQRPVIQASEILAKIERGEDVEYDGVIVEGDLDISGLELPTEHERKVIGLQITIINSEFCDKVDLSNAHFHKTINLKGSEFGIGAIFENAEFIGGAIFENAKFGGKVHFEDVEFGGKTLFWNAVFGGDTYFGRAKFASELADFRGAEFVGHVHFEDATFCGYTDFRKTKFGVDVNFRGAEFGEVAHFEEAKFNGIANFKDADFTDRAEFEGATFFEIANFEKAKFDYNAAFKKANFEGKTLTFKNAKFNRPDDQEYVCRKAKQILEQSGDRDEASYNFYLEMDAKRRQKPIYKSYPEKLLVQLIFGYGVYPIRVISTWIITISVFAFIYWNWNMVAGAKSPIDYIWFSIATAATPGYALYKPSGAYQLVSGLEAILGTFLWAAFIATFARKWMR
jgi:uncharacterized protein YjbI with pentapeptide repeats